MEESELIGKEPCPSCGSKDNLARYSDGHAYCFSPSCDYREPADGEEDRPQKKPLQKASFTPIEGEFQPLRKRKISQDTCKKFGYRVGRFNGKTVQVCDVKDKDGSLVGQKVRFAGKDFLSLGSVGKTLIGMHLWSGGKRLIITEGEIDMMSYSQVQSNKYPVVSLPNGAGSAKKAISHNLEYLANFEEICLCFDNDEAGREATETAAKLLMHLNVKIIRFELKDANEMLVEGRIEDLTKAMWNAEKYKPAAFKTLADIREDVLKPVERGVPWCFDFLTEATYGRREGEVYFLGAGTGVGKTDFFTQQIAFDVQELKKKVAVFYLEMDLRELGKRVCGKFKNRLFHVPDAGWTQEELEDALSDPEINENVLMWDSFGCTDFDEIEAGMIYAAAQGYTHIYLDHLTALATGEDKDERAVLEDICGRMAQTAKRYGLVLHVISHLTTPDNGPSHEEGGRVTIRQFKGSRAIGFWAYFMFGLERNQQSDDPEIRQTTIFRILKDRYTGQSTGLTHPLGYETSTGTLYPKTYIEEEAEEEEDFGFWDRKCD